MREKVINLDSRKQEIMKNIPGFPISCYYSRFSQDTYDYIDWHWHVDFQFCLTVRGTVLWSTESCRDAVSEGKAIFINSQRTHMAKPLGKEAAFFCVNFSPDFICPVREESLYENSVLPVLQGPALNRKVIDCHTVRGAEILDILTEMARTFDAKEDGYQFDLMGNVFKIWKRMRTLLDGELTQQMDTVDIRFQNMLTYLQKHYAVEFSLDAVADYIGLSRSECCRYFKKQSGQTISDYLLQYRIHKSMNLLTGTDTGIAEVAQACGFSNQSYYTKRFRELTGMTPKQYRLRQG